jgi:hypothetical protein
VVLVDLPAKLKKREIPLGKGNCALHMIIEEAGLFTSARTKSRWNL